jgi:hypothetical protein
MMAIAMPPYRLAAANRLAAIAGRGEMVSGAYMRLLLVAMTALRPLGQQQTL